jgi:hypothetical protein
MKKIAGWMAAPAAALWWVAARAQEEVQAPVIEEGVHPMWAGVFVALVLGLIVWFVIAMVRAESKRKAEQKSA